MNRQNISLKLLHFWDLTKKDSKESSLIRKFVAIILVLPFSTADYERAFSAMSNIKTKSRNRLKSILRSLMLIYTAEDSDINHLDKDDLAKVVAHKVWGRRQWASKGYLMMLI